MLNKFLIYKSNLPEENEALFEAVAKGDRESSKPDSLVVEAYRLQTEGDTDGGVFVTEVTAPHL